MTQPDSSSIARILASPFQQRLNAANRWGVPAVLALCAAAPVSFMLWSLVADPRLVPRLREQAVDTSFIGVTALLAVGWMMLIGNLLQQNRPAIARLVPGHVARLRTALLLAWIVLVLAVTAGPGFALGAPLAWACGAAGSLALLAAALRWPALWLLALALPLVVLPMAGTDAVAARDSLEAAWQRDAWLVTALVATGGALALVAMVREQGHERARSLYEAGRACGRRFARPGPGCAPQSDPLPRPYVWWMKRQLVRRDSTAEGRLLLGLGSAVHWTTRSRDIALFTLVGGGVCSLVVGLAAYLGRDLRGALPWLAFSLLTGACTPALQAAARLHRTRGEQALLVLLPGVPRGARLNRWLSWQMSVLFLVSALWGLVLAGTLDFLAEALSPGLVARSGGDMTAAVAVALLPQVAWQWRSWARLPGASGLEFLPSLAPLLLGGVALLLHLWAGIDDLPMGLGFMALALAYCAWRWWRMGGEPTAMPIGRLAG